jgi:(p)ppGpp synthase/HD superfamily hydrolase
LYLSPLIDKALAVASRAHKGQIRKNPRLEIPYIQHPVMVGFILQKAGYDDRVVAAGILHDVLEDTKISQEELEKEFGKEIAVLVNQVSEQDKSLSWEVRKERYWERLKTIPAPARAIVTADNIHNIHSIIDCLNQDIDIWSVFKRGKEIQMKKFNRLLGVLESCFQHPLVEELAGVIKQLESMVK